VVVGSNPEENPVPIPLIVQKMETLKARREELELAELARRFEKIDTQEQVIENSKPCICSSVHPFDCPSIQANAHPSMQMYKCFSTSVINTT
jgi:hypothetical protein